MKRLIIPLVLLVGLMGCGTTGRDSKGAESARVHTELAGMYFQMGKYGVALEELGLALEADGNYGPAYGVRGLVRMALREDKDAEEDFQKGLRLDKANSEIHNNYGWFLCQRDRAKESIPHFMAALKNPLYQTPGRAWLNAGICSRKAGNNRDAAEFLQRALDAQPDLSQASLELADLNLATGDYFAAKKHFTRFAEKSGGLTAEQLWLGVRIARKNGDRNSEYGYGTKLRRLYPDSRETQMLLRGE